MTQPALRFAPINCAAATERWRDYESLVADQPWMAWSADRYALPLPDKFSLSREALDGEGLAACMICSNVNGWLWLHRLAVAASRRGRGVGAACLAELRRAAAAAGLKGVMLKTPCDQPRAAAFYDRAGCRRLPPLGDHHMMALPTGPEGLTVAIHQPNYIPWLGYFYKMAMADVFVFLDDVTFQRGSFVARNRIDVGGEAKWLTVPLTRSLSSQINHAAPPDSRWVVKHLKSIQQSYRDAAHFERHFPAFETLLQAQAAGGGDVATINVALLRWFAAELGLKPVFYRSSEIGSEGAGDDRLVSIARHVAADVYVSGAGGANYQSEDTFRAAGMRLRYTDYAQTPYPRSGRPFLPYLSALDALLHIGAEGVRALLDAGRAAPQSAAGASTPATST